VACGWPYSGLIAREQSLCRRCVTVLCRSRVRGRRAAVKSDKGKATSNEGELVDRPDVRLVDDGGLTIAVDQVSRRSRSHAPCAHPRSLARECLAFFATQACNRLALIVVATALHSSSLIIARAIKQRAFIHAQAGAFIAAPRCSSLLENALRSSPLMLATVLRSSSLLLATALCIQRPSSSLSSQASCPHPRSSSAGEPLLRSSLLIVAHARECLACDAQPRSLARECLA
jgi:hypothetical protein